MTEKQYALLILKYLKQPIENLLEQDIALDSIEIACRDTFELEHLKMFLVNCKKIALRFWKYRMTLAIEILLNITWSGPGAGERCDSCLRGHLSTSPSRRLSGKTNFLVVTKLHDTHCSRVISIGS